MKRHDRLEGDAVFKEDTTISEPSSLYHIPSRGMTTPFSLSSTVVDWRQTHVQCFQLVASDPSIELFSQGGQCCKR